MSGATESVRVAALEEVPSDTFLVVEVGGVEIGVVRDGDHLHAVRNICPHHSAPICRGRVRGTVMPTGAPTLERLEYGLDRRVVICPWHQFEFDLDTGKPLFTDVKGRLRTFPVSVVDGDVFIEVKARQTAASGGTS